MNTKKLLSNTMKSLLGEKPLKDITVSEIVSTCEIARSTFYVHFEDKYDLVGYTLPSDQIVELAMALDHRDYKEVLEDLLALVRDWRVVYANAMDDPFDELIYRKLFDNATEFYQQSFFANDEANKSDAGAIIKELAIKQVVDFLLNWTLGVYDIRVEEAADIMARLWPAELFAS